MSCILDNSCPEICISMHSKPCVLVPSHEHIYSGTRECACPACRPMRTLLRGLLLIGLDWHQHACTCCQPVLQLMLQAGLVCSWMVRGCWSLRASTTGRGTMTCGYWMCPASSGRSWRLRGRRPPHVPTTLPSNFKTASTCSAGMLRRTSSNRLLLSYQHDSRAGPVRHVVRCQQVSCCMLQGTEYCIVGCSSFGVSPCIHLLTGPCTNVSQPCSMQ